MITASKACVIVFTFDTVLVGSHNLSVTRRSLYRCAQSETSSQHSLGYLKNLQGDMLQEQMPNQLATKLVATGGQDFKTFFFVFFSFVGDGKFRGWCVSRSLKKSPSAKN